MVAKLPLIVIVGPTASGKTRLAIDIAKMFGGEIVCADSRTVYRGMDIGTAKPSLDDMREVSHHIIDVVDPGEKFSLWNFQQLAKEKIEDIRNRKKIPLLVGGSGLYIDSVVFDYNIRSETINQSLRDELNQMTIDDLIMMIKIQHIELPENYKNKRYLIRAIERRGINRNRRCIPDSNTYIVGITTEKDILKQRIYTRAKLMLESGFIGEVQSLVDNYGNLSIFQNNAYGEVQRFLLGEISDQSELIERMATVDLQLAKKQLTWFKRNEFIKWLDLERAAGYISDVLSLEHNISYF